MLKRVKGPEKNYLRLRYRVFCGADIALGPGKVQLLEFVRETGSIRRAAAQMEMSYMRAWGLIRTMNQCFREPLVVSVRGGAHRGGATLTPMGAAVLELYEQMEQQGLAATEGTRRQLAALLKDKSQ